MATHRTDVSVGFAAPDPLESKIQPAENLLLHVPDVRMLTEAAATATIASVGLVPGQRIPRPRPVSGIREVVIRTFPRVGTLVQRGTRVDFELLPGQPSDRAVTLGDADYDAMEAHDEPGRQPAEGQA